MNRITTPIADNGMTDGAIERYVDILSNAGFKAVFGDRSNKDVVMSIINALLPSHRQVTDIDYLPTEHSGPTLENKDFRFDFMCRAADGTAFIVEAQCYNDEYWFRRSVSYASRMYGLQSRKGADYDVAPVYFIGLMGVNMLSRDGDEWFDRYVSEYTFREKFSHDLLDETIILIFAELARFDKRGEDCVTDLDRMCYLLKNSGNLRNHPSWIRQKVYARILDACRIAGFSEAKRIQYDKDMYDERRLNSELGTARRMGIREGMEKGIEKGKAETVKAMIAAGIPVDAIAAALGMTAEECMAL